MYRSPLQFLSRTLMVGCAVGLGATGLYGQAASAPATPPQMAPQTAPISRVDIFLGYSYLAPHGTVTTTNGAGVVYPERYGAVDYGAIGSVSYFFNKYVGGTIDYADHTLGQNDGFRTAAAGLVFRYPTDQGVTPFVHAMAGGAQVGGPNAETVGIEHPYTWGPLLKVGGGLDYDTPFFNHHLGIRLFQADYTYMHADFGPQSANGGRANIDSAELSSGILLKLGNITPPPPVTYACTVSPESVFPGDPVTVTGTASNLNPKKTATYTWSGQGFTVTGDSNVGNIATASLAPGQYTVTGHVSEGTKPGQFADCTANFTVKQFEPPTISCSANPSSVNPGDSSTITAVGVSPQNRPLTYSYSASSGTISGTTNTATLTTTGAPAGAITVTCNVADDKGQTATTTTTVTVNAPPPPPAPKVQTLCAITFDRDKRRPARVDNEAKACLDDVTLNMQRSTDASLVVVGNAAPSEAPAGKGRHHMAAMDPAKLAAQRAVNTKDYLVKEKGVDASRISVRTGTKGTNEVDDYLVPSGANFDSEQPGTTAVSDNVQPQSRTAAAGGHHRRHHKAAAAQQ